MRITRGPAQRLFPVFWVPLGDGWFDVMLRATVTNFAGATEADKTVYECDSYGATGTAHEDTNALFYFTDPTSADPRIWRTKTAASIQQSLTSPSGGLLHGVLVMPSKITGSSTWMFQDNTNLRWVYRRVGTNADAEQGPFGGDLWTPITPIEWRDTRQ
jgi:hypothetical protein